MISWILNLFGCKAQTNENNNRMPTDEEITQSIQSFLNRPIYKKLTKEIIDTLPDQELNQTIFDNISINMEGDKRNASDIIKGLSKGQQAIYSIWIVESEVNNGGFNQLYFNGYEEIVKIAESGFSTIGAHGFADLTKRANLLYKEIKPDLQKYDDGTVESFSKSYENNPLDTFDTEFFKLYEKEKLTDLIIDYVRKNTDEFIDK